jgi:hypothetical protein
MPFDGGARWQIEIAAADKTAQAFASVDKRMRGLQASQDEAAGSLKTLAGVAETFEGVAKGMIGLETISRLQAWHDSVQQAAVSIKEQAEAANTSTDALQTWQGAFRAANTNVEAGTGAVTAFGEAARNASMGNKDAAEAFQTLGVRILNNSGKLRDQNTILGEASRAVLAAGDSAKAAAAAHVLFGQSGDALSRTLQQTSRDFTDLEAVMRRTGQVMTSETIETFDQLKNRSDEAANRVRNLYAEIAAPLHLAVVEAANRAFSNLAENIGKASGNWLTLVNLMTNPFGTVAALTYTTELKDATDQLIAKEKELANLQKPVAADVDRNPYRQQRIDALQKELGLLRQRQQVLSVSGKQNGTPSDPDNISVLPATTVTGNKFAQPTPSGGGAGDRDRIGEELRRLTGEADSARKAYENLQAAAATASSTEDLQRQVALQKAIGDELARIGKYSASDPRIGQLKQIITEHETWEYRLKSLDAALKAADATEKQFGDGTAEMRRRQTELNEALATGRLSQDAYAAATKAAGMAQEEQALKAKQYNEGFDGLIAGMQYAALEARRAGSSFNQGMQLWQGAIDPVKSELDSLANGAEFSFQRIGVAWAKMLSDMAFKAATAQIGDALFGGAKGATGSAGGGLGGILGGLFGGLFGGGGVTAAAAPAGGYGGFAGYAMTLPGFATGGQSPVGTPYLVGERGPEVRVDGRPGQIFNRSQWDASDGGGSGGRGITIMVAGDTDLVRVTAQDEAGKAIAVASPQIQGKAVKRATKLAPRAVANDKAMRTVDWRS